ncbi:hypothetical protein D3C85_1752130 [compost metagenome]
MPVRVEQSCTALDVQQRMQPDVIEHADEIVTHRPDEAGRFLRGLSGVLQGGALAQLFTRFIQRTAGLLQARRDAAYHNPCAGIDVIKRGIEGLQIAF